MCKQMQIKNYTISYWLLTINPRLYLRNIMENDFRNGQPIVSDLLPVESDCKSNPNSVSRVILMSKSGT